MVEWASSGTPRGSSLTSKASVGNDSYSIAFASDDYEELLHTRHTWVGLYHPDARTCIISETLIGSPIERTGSLGLVKAGDKAYIPLTIDLTFPRADKSYINYYMKNATFRITTPSVAVPSTSTRGSTPSASSTEAPLPQTPSAKMPIAAIAGGIAGIVVLGLFAAFFFLYRRRKTAKRESLVELMTPTTKSWHSDSMSSLQANESLITPWSIPARSNPSPAHTLPQTTPPVVKPSITPASTNNASRSHRGPSNGTSMFSRPPAYDAGPSFGTSRGESSWATNTLPVFSRSSSSGPSGASRGESALSQWARAHRAFISGKLEAKLDAAGYMPADDPDSMTETEWMDTWGVTKLELGRLKALFAERQQY